MNWTEVREYGGRSKKVRRWGHARHGGRIDLRRALFHLAVWTPLLAVGPGVAVLQERQEPTERAPRSEALPGVPPYDRAAFGRPWADVDGNGCDTRNDELAAAMGSTARVAADGCTVLEGTFVDPYTGETVRFVKGTTTSALAPIDHVRSLREAWDDGAWTWTPEERLAFANDPRNLVATTRSVNSAKSDRGPADWSTPWPAADCAYVQTYVLVGASYGLATSPSDTAALDRRSDTCNVNLLTGR